MRKGGNYLVLSDSTAVMQADNTGPRPYPQLLQDHIATYFKQPIHLIHKGIPGADSTHFVNGLHYFTRFSDLDLVTIGLGTNDCGKGTNTVSAYGDNLRKLINRILLVNPNVPIVLCTPSTEGVTNIFNSYSKTDADFTAYRTMCDTVASEYETVYVCHFENAWTVAQSSTYTVDGTHPRPVGHTLLEASLWSVVQPILNLSQ